jgi:hypothetical protein
VVYKPFANFSPHISVHTVGVLVCTRLTQTKCPPLTGAEIFSKQCTRSFQKILENVHGSLIIQALKLSSQTLQKYFGLLPCSLFSFHIYSEGFFTSTLKNTQCARKFICTTSIFSFIKISLSFSGLLSFSF